MRTPVAATLADAPDVMALLARCREQLQARGIPQWDDLYPTLPVVEADARAGSLYVLREDAPCIAAVGLDEVQPAIYASVAWRHSSDRALIVHRLAVDPTRQRNGLAREMMAFAEGAARARGCTAIRLDAYTDNPAAMAFFSHLGFAHTGEVFFPRRPRAFACFEKLLLP